MKTRFLLSTGMAIALACTFNLTAYGNDDDDDDGESSRKSVHAVVALSATTNAPAGARGVAKLELEHDDGEMEAELELKLVGLAAGDYLLSVTQTNGTNLVLAKVTIGTHRDDGDDDDEWHDRWNWGGFANWGSWANWITNWCNASNRPTEVEIEVDLPAGLNPADLAQLILSDTNGVPLLIGDLHLDRECQTSMNAVVFLAATTNAPAGARGVAKLEVEHDDGEVEAELELKLVGLAFGDYLLSVTRTDGTNLVLGKLTIGKHREDDDDRDEDEDGDHDWDDWWDRHHRWIKWNWGGFTNWGSWTNWSIINWCNASNRATAVEAEVDLPAGLNPVDIAQIILSDTNGVPLLIGDLIKPAPSSVLNISAVAQVLPGSVDSAATGLAEVRSTAVRGKWKHQFKLAATGLDPRSALRAYVNEKKAGATKSNRYGAVTLRKLPSRTPAVRTVELLDSSGNVAARAQF